MDDKKHIKAILREFISQAIREDVEDDTYSSYKGMKPYKQRKQDFINSITSFSDITDDKIQEIFDYFGTEGYNDEEEAFDDFKDRIRDWANLPNPAKLYRVVGVKNKRAIRKDDLGEHWTPYKWNLDSDMLMSIGYEEWDDETKPYVIEALVPHSEIDIIQTIVQNLTFPNEHEVNLKNNGKNIKFIKSYRLEGF